MRRLLLVLMATACSGSPTEPADTVVAIYGRRPMVSVPSTYASWYTEVEAACGKTGHFGAAQWFLADSIHVGRFPWTNAIELPHALIIEEGYESHRPTVGHAMARHVLQTAGAPGCGY